MARNLFSSVEEPQQQKLQTLGQLAGGVAHDFNNILSIIQGYARMLEKSMGPHHPAHEKLNMILAAVKRGEALTKQILNFARTDDVHAVSSCDLVKTVREAEFLLRPLLTSRINLMITVPEEPILVACDSGMITQILINMAANARDAIRKSGKVWIDVIGTGTKAILTVGDDGCGMSPEIMRRMFEPFYTTKARGQGTGLGLSLVWEMMQHAGGTIHTDTAPGEGTVFTLTFPRRSSRLYPQEVKQDNIRTETRLRQKTILVVDDEEALLPVLEHQLTELGMTVLKAANADSALVLQRDYPDTIDLLLTDVVMPDVNGIKLAEMVTQARPETGVVFMTGFPGADGNPAPMPEDALILQKPLPAEQLSPTLIRALQRVRDDTLAPF